MEDVGGGTGAGAEGGVAWKRCVASSTSDCACLGDPSLRDSDPCWSQSTLMRRQERGAGEGTMQHQMDVMKQSSDCSVGCHALLKPCSL